MPKKGNDVNRSSKKYQRKENKKYNVYSKKTVRIKETIMEKNKK